MTDTCDTCGDWIEIHAGEPVCKSGCKQPTTTEDTMSTTITLTDEETTNLIGMLGHISDDLHDRFYAYSDDPEFVETYQPMIDIIARIQALIANTTTEDTMTADTPTPPQRTP